MRRLRKDENVRRERAILVSIATTHVSQLLSPWKQGEPAQSLHCLRGDNFLKKENKTKTLTIIETQTFDKNKREKIMKATVSGSC